MIENLVKKELKISLAMYFESDLLQRPINFNNLITNRISELICLHINCYNITLLQHHNKVTMLHKIL